MAGQTPNPVIQQGNYTWYTSSQIFALYPELYAELVRSRGSQLLPFLDQRGGMNGMSGNAMGNLSFNHLEEDWYRSLIMCDAHNAGAANAGVVLTIAAAYELTFPSAAQAPYTYNAQTTTNPVQDGDIILFPNQVMAKVRSRSTTQFTAYPLVSGENIPAVLTTDEIVIIGNAFEEGSTQPGSQTTRQLLYTGMMQTLKKTYSLTDRQAQMTSWIDYTDSHGKTAKMAWLEDQYIMAVNHQNDIVMTMLTGKNLTNQTLAALEPTTITTEGLIPFIANNGNIYNYSLVPGLQLADFKQIITTLDKERGCMENTMWAGILASGQVDDFMRDTMKNGSISYGSFGGNAQKAIDLNFFSFNYMGYSFHKNTYAPFNYKVGLGAAGQPYPNTLVICPSDNRPATFGNGTVQSVPSWRMNYLKNAGQSQGEYMHEFQLGSLMGVSTQPEAVWSDNFRSTIGFEGFAANRFMLVQPV